MIRSTNRSHVLSIRFGHICIVVATLMLNGCDIKFQGIQGSGVSKSETRTVAEFDQIEIDGVGTVNITFSETPSLQVTFDDNLLQYLKTEVIDGTLKISSSESTSSATGPTFDIVMNKVNAVDIDGAAKVNILDAKLDNFKLRVDGACTFVADGVAESLEIDMSGAGRIDANELKAKSVKISISGAAKADVFASETLDANISGAGRVNCLGNPKGGKRDVSGAGRINVK